MTIPYELLKHARILEDDGPGDYTTKLYLTDWLILRHLEEISVGKETSLTVVEYNTLVAKRDQWRKDGLNHRFNSKLLDIVGLPGLFNTTDK